MKIMPMFAAAALIASGCTICNSPKKEPTMIQKAVEDSLIPIRPGNAKRPFWNTYAKQFIYVPAFEFKKVKGAKSYLFHAEDRSGVDHTFTADTPYALFTPVWNELPVGRVYVTVDALDGKGKKIGSAGERVFYRNAVFNNGYPPKTRSYAECAKAAYDYLYRNEYINELDRKKPDLKLELYCYPSKMHAGIIQGMVNFASMEPRKRKKALAIACGAANYLIETAVPNCTPLEYLPLTYVGDKLTAKKFGDTIMMLYPASVDSAMIALSDAVKEKKYLDYAVRIGDQYLKLQQPDGTWYLKLKISTGKPDGSNVCAPVGIMSFLEKLSKVTGKKKYSAAAKKALPQLKKMYDSFDWEGQFEDVEAQKEKYINLTFHNAVGMFLYLCPQDPKNKTLTAQAREIQRYAEDQFIFWEQPGWTGSANCYRWRTKEDTIKKEWGWYHHIQMPCVLEQYRCYVPVDGSSGKMIRYYLMMYDLEKNPLDLAKARALGDAITRIQVDGRIPTWCDPGRPSELDWFNCMFGTADAMKLLSEYDSIK